MDWKRRDYSLSSRPGFLLAEALVVLLILSLSAALAAPAPHPWSAIEASLSSPSWRRFRPA